MSNKTEPLFTPQFPQKSIYLAQDTQEPIEMTFSSMEEAEWKLLDEIPGRYFFDTFGRVLQEEPSSMDYSFASLLKEEVISPIVTSEDGLARFIGVPNDFVQQSPSMLVQYRHKGAVRVAGTEWDEARYYSLYPLTVNTFKNDDSTLYYVWGNSDYKFSRLGYRMRAYELDDTGLHPALTYESKVVDSCVIADYFLFENKVAESIRDETITKEQCCRYLCLSEEMCNYTHHINILARASVLHRLGAFYVMEQHEEEAFSILRYMIDELLEATEKLGPNEDWDEYLIHVSEVLCHYYNVKGDTEDLKKYASIAREAQKRCEQ